MKILYMGLDQLPFTYPKMSVGGGGVSTLDPVIIQALESKHEVHFLVPEDSEMLDERRISGEYLSKKAKFRCPVRKIRRTEKMISLAGDFDRIVWNDTRFSWKLLDEIKRIAPKIRAINHSEAKGYTSSFNVGQYHLHYVISQHGAKVAHVQSTADEHIERNLRSIRKNPHLIPGEPVGAFGKNFHWIDLLVTSPGAFEGELSSENIWVSVGRASKDKRLKFAVESWQESGVEGEMILFVSNSMENKSDLPDLLEMSEKDPRIKVVQNATHDLLFETLRKARGMVFPSMYESMGLCPFEANCHGVPVVYTVLESERFLGLVEGNIHVPKRDKKEYSAAIKEIDFFSVADHKRGMRERTKSLFPPERIAQGVLDFVEMD